jgi:adenylate kinase family enzyme
MADDYEKAFALLDNPFEPLGDIEGVGNQLYQSDLASRPLLLNREPALERLYSSDAGPFGTYLKNFQAFARKSGYRDAPPPPKAGKKSFIFSIYGNEGTGKTTLAQAIINWLKKCKPKNGQWYVSDDMSLTKVADVGKQIEVIESLQQRIKDNVSQGGHCCVVLDNLVKGAMPRALDMYDQLTSGWFVFLFLVSSDVELFQALANNGKRLITPFWMRSLSANSAVSFVRDRIKAFRPEFGEQRPAPPWLDKYPLFPFSEGDIRSAFDSGDVMEIVQADTISLRQFAGILTGILAEQLDGLDEDFDIAQVPEEQISQYLLKLTPAYTQLVENRLVVNG